MFIFLLFRRVPEFNDDLRQGVLRVLKEAGFKVVPSATYVQTIGPRFETKAEVRFLASVAHIVGMTCAHEVVLAKELNIPYATVAMVDNYANGITHQLSIEEFQSGVRTHINIMEDALG